MENLKIILVGATGQMGKTISNLVDTIENIEIVYGVADENGRDLKFPVSEDFPTEKIANVLVDFSTPKLLKNILNYGISTNTPLVLATTGYSLEDLEKIEEASTVIPILQTGNMSVGVNVMEMVVETLSRILEGYDIEIVEKHHKYKVDSPSGTAKMLFEAANRGRENKLNSLEGRAGFFEERPGTEVGISSIRGGNIVGEHSVIFAGVDEIIEIKHIANSKAIFASGAIRGAKFLANKNPGLYTMDDVLEISNEQN